MTFLNPPLPHYSSNHVQKQANIREAKEPKPRCIANLLSSSNYFDQKSTVLFPGKTQNHLHTSSVVLLATVPHNTSFSSSPRFLHRIIYATGRSPQDAPYAHQDFGVEKPSIAFPNSAHETFTVFQTQLLVCWLDSSKFLYQLFN